MYLNNPHELIEGIITIQDIQKNISNNPEAFRSYYITSFPSCNDNLSM